MGLGRDWDLVHWALDHRDFWLASRDLASGDDFKCTDQEADGLRPFLHARGLDIVLDEGRGYVMSVAEAAKVGPAGAAYGSAPVTELTRPMWRAEKTLPDFAGFDDDEPTQRDLAIPAEWVR
jgi:hypothetical protein